MKLKIITIIGAILLTGCASMYGTKEELKSIITLAANGKYAGARQKLSNSNSLMGYYKTYTDVTLPPADEAYTARDNVTDLINGIEGKLDWCEDAVDKISKLSFKTANEGQVWFLDKVKKLDVEFDQTCVDGGKHLSEKIDAYADVDISPKFIAIQKRFKPEVERIYTEVKKDESDKQAANQEAIKKQEEHENSPAFYSKKLCEMTDFIKAANNVISREQEITKVSGTTRPGKLHEAGEAIVINQKRIKHFSAEYKRKFGKSWSASSCKD